MLTETKKIVSMTDANQNFSRVAKLVDDKGAAVIMKNNQPKYLVIKLNADDEPRSASRDDVQALSQKLIEKNLKAYRELAK